MYKPDPEFSSTREQLEDALRIFDESDYWVKVSIQISPNGDGEHLAHFTTTLKTPNGVYNSVDDLLGGGESKMDKEINEILESGDESLIKMLRAIWLTNGFKIYALPELMRDSANDPK